MNLPRLDKLNEFPPFLCHALARSKNGGYRTRRLPLAQLAASSGLGLSKFVRIALKTSWNNVSNEDMERFCNACGVAPWGSMASERRFFNRQMKRKVPFEYLREDGRLRRFNGLCIRWLAAREARR